MKFEFYLVVYISRHVLDLPRHLISFAATRVILLITRDPRVVRGGRSRPEQKVGEFCLFVFILTGSRYFGLADHSVRLFSYFFA